MKRISVIPAREVAGCSREIPGFKVWIFTRCVRPQASQVICLSLFATSKMESLIILTLYIILKIKGDNDYVKHPESESLRRAKHRFFFFGRKRKEV